MHNPQQKMAIICSVPDSQITFNRLISAYNCMCGCGLEISAFCLKKLTKYEGELFHQLHGILSNGNGQNPKMR